MRWFRERLRKFVDAGIRSFIKAEERWEIRKDFMEIYEESVNYLYNNPKTHNKWNLPNYRWYLRAVESGERSINCDPHKKVIDAIDKNVERVGEIGNIINYFQILLIAPIVFTFCATGLIYLILGYVDKIMVILGILILLGNGVLSLYKRLLLLDKEAFQTINRSLVINLEDKYYKQAKKERLIAVNVWNLSLSKYDTIPTIALLILFKKTLGRAYQVFKVNMITVVAPYMPEYIDSKSKWRLLSYMIHYYSKNFGVIVRKVREEDVVEVGSH